MTPDNEILLFVFFGIAWCGAIILALIVLSALACLRTPKSESHAPLLYRDNGSPILGLKRCVKCGLSETYWQRFPSCTLKGGN